MAPNKKPARVVHFKESALRAVSFSTDTSLIKTSNKQENTELHRSNTTNALTIYTKRVDYMQTAKEQDIGKTKHTELTQDTRRKKRK